MPFLRHVPCQSLTWRQQWKNGIDSLPFLNRADFSFLHFRLSRQHFFQELVQPMQHCSRIFQQTRCHACIVQNLLCHTRG